MHTYLESDLVYIHYPSIYLSVELENLANDFRYIVHFFRVVRMLYYVLLDSFFFTNKVQLACFFIAP